MLQDRFNIGYNTIGKTVTIRWDGGSTSIHEVLDVKDGKVAIQGSGSKRRWIPFSYITHVHGDTSNKWDGKDDDNSEMTKYSKATDKTLFVKTTRSAEVLRQAIKDQSLNVRHAAASNIHATEDVLREAVTAEYPQSGSWEVRRAAASNPSVTKDILDICFNDSIDSVRAAAASNEKATEDQLLKAIKDNSDIVRTAATMNKNATPSVLNIAVKDPNHKVRGFAINHKNANLLTVTIGMKDEVSWHRRDAEQKYRALRQQGQVKD